MSFPVFPETFSDGFAESDGSSVDLLGFNLEFFNFNTFPIYNPLELTCFVRNYCFMFLSTVRNLQAFQFGKRKRKR